MKSGETKKKPYKVTESMPMKLFLMTVCAALVFLVAGTAAAALTVTANMIT